MKQCFCKNLNGINTNSKFIILIHPKELKKEKAATGRLTKISLSNSELIDGIDFSNNEKVNFLLNQKDYFPVLLYPGENSINLSKDKFPNELILEKKLMIFVLDGTWCCAKKMLKLSTNLQNLPKICFTNLNKSEFLIKQQPHPDCLSTIESCYYLLNALNISGLEEISGHEQMLNVFREMRDFYISCANDPNRDGYRRKSYTLPSERVVRKKNGRKIFF